MSDSLDPMSFCFFKFGRMILDSTDTIIFESEEKDFYLRRFL